MRMPFFEQLLGNPTSRGGNATDSFLCLFGVCCVILCYFDRKGKSEMFASKMDCR